MTHYDSERGSKYNNKTKSSDGLVELLLRHGVKPTHDSKKDIELARSFMPRGYDDEFRL